MNYRRKCLLTISDTAWQPIWCHIITNAMWRNFESLETMQIGLFCFLFWRKDFPCGAVLPGRCHRIHQVHCTFAHNCSFTRYNTSVNSCLRVIEDPIYHSGLYWKNDRPLLVQCTCDVSNKMSPGNLEVPIKQLFRQDRNYPIRISLFNNCSRDILVRTSKCCSSSSFTYYTF